MKLHKVIFGNKNCSQPIILLHTLHISPVAMLISLALGTCADILEHSTLTCLKPF